MLQHSTCTDSGTSTASGFNGHPPLGVDATGSTENSSHRAQSGHSFQRAPTLGGGCYCAEQLVAAIAILDMFQRAPTLGGGCYESIRYQAISAGRFAFQRAPTLGGGCYKEQQLVKCIFHEDEFQRAPTLGGGCYHCPTVLRKSDVSHVSTGTHPWGWMLLTDAAP